jgi:microcystin-dependent protein
MSQPYVGEIRMFGGNFAPAGWMFCQGQLLPISEFETLFNLIGTTYGGDGQTTFGLPDLRGRVPIHQGTGPGLPTYTLAQNGGTPTVTLTTQQIPAHPHAYIASTTAGNANSPQNTFAANGTTNVSPYYDSSAKTPMGANSIGNSGGNQPHDNMQPYLCIDFIISLFGIYPSPT